MPLLYLFHTSYFPQLDARLQRKAEKGSATPERPSLSQLPPAINPSMLHSPASPPQSQKAAPVPYLPQQPLPPNGPSSLQSHMSPSLGYAPYYIYKLLISCYAYLLSATQRVLIMEEPLRQLPIPTHHPRDY